MNYHSRLSTSDVEEIKRMLSEGVKQTEIAAMFKVSQGVVSAIKNNCRYDDEIRIRGIPEVTKTLLNNIIRNKGIDKGLYLKMAITEKLNSEPDHLKRTPPEF